MKNVTIRRCPTCSNIGSHTDQLAADLRNDPNVKVNVVDGAKGEFSVEVDGRKINGMSGESLRDASDLATEIRGGQSATAV
jgi:enoyl-CoA hydratase/carnithine racemase